MFLECVLNVQATFEEALNVQFEGVRSKPTTARTPSVFKGESKTSPQKRSEEQEALFVRGDHQVD